MTDRVIRDELLTSERYWSVSIQAQQLYVHLILCVDDAARFSGKNFTIRAACYPGRAIEASDIERWLLEMIDADLIRVYFTNGERFLFVPRFRNRRRYVGSSKYPVPPNEINDLGEEKSDSSQPKDVPKSDPSQEERSGVGEKKEKPTVSLALTAARRVPACPVSEIVGLYHEHLPTLPAVVALSPSRKRTISARWREVCTQDRMDRNAGLEWFAWFFQHAAKSGFLTGRTPGKSGRTWRADLDFLMTASKFPRVVEGAYHKETA